MHTKITTIIPGSPASKTIIMPGDSLRKINGNKITDVLDYQYYSYDKRLSLELTGNEGKIKLIRIRKPEGADLGLEFESSLMDKQQSCGNKCIFCFIDQLPKGMRDTLYYKDDDVRLSFLQGNYVTLTNLSKKDIERIIKLRISPINVSIHTLDPVLRQFMLGKNRKSIYSHPQNHIAQLASAGIMLNCQIVCCPGINDKKELDKTIEGLMELGPAINSVSIVPVGLTKHRKGLFKLRAFDKKLAEKTVKQVEKYGKKCLKERGSTVFYCADELYMMAGLKLPPEDFYEDFPQLENGVGMMRLFISEFKNSLECLVLRPQDTPAVPLLIKVNHSELSSAHISIATGTLAAPYISKLVLQAAKKCGTIKCDVHAIKNNFFGESVTVSGLVTGRDIIEQLKGKNLGKKLLIPQNMLRHEDVVFLDDVTIQDLEDELGVPVEVVGIHGSELLKCLDPLLP